MVQLTVFHILSGIAAGAAAFQLPPLPGPHLVGTESFQLIDYSRIDPLAPTPEVRRLMVSLFYPTSDDGLYSGDYTFAPYFTPTAATVADAYFGFSPGTSANLTTQSLLNAPILNTEFPLLLFSHGYGGSRLVYTAQVEALVSHGWIVAVVDHTYDALFVEFPDGQIVQSPYTDSSQMPGGVVGDLDVRAADLNFVTSALQNSSVLEQLSAFNSSSCLSKPRADRVGAFGHSLGGATAAVAVANYTRFQCGINFDGSIWGPVTEIGLDRPFLQMAAQNHNQTSDATWAQFWSNLRGFRRQFNVQGTVHESFMDIIVIRDLVGDAFPANQSALYGSIAGRRLLEIETAYTDAFFSYCLKGETSERLDSLSREKFPEVSIGH